MEFHLSSFEITFLPPFFCLCHFFPSHKSIPNLIPNWRNFFMQQLELIHLDEQTNFEFISILFLFFSLKKTRPEVISNTFCSTTITYVLRCFAKRFGSFPWRASTLFFLLCLSDFLFLISNAASEEMRFCSLRGDHVESYLRAKSLGVYSDDKFKKEKMLSRFFNRSRYF